MVGQRSHDLPSGYMILMQVDLESATFYHTEKSGLGHIFTYHPYGYPTFLLVAHIDADELACNEHGTGVGS